MKWIPRWLREALLVACCFAVVYGGANLLAGLHGWRIQVHGAWELGLPFRPEFAPVYLSISPVMVLVAFLLRQDPEALRRLRRVLVAEILVAGLCFLLLPAELAPGFARPAPVPWTAWLAACAAVGLRYNLFPSLHVAFAVTTAWHAPRRARAGLFLWAVLVAAATLLLHLHHVLDVAGGLLLAWVVENRSRPRPPCPPLPPSPPA